MNILKKISFVGLFFSVALAGNVKAETPDNYVGLSLQTDDSVLGVFGKYEIKELSDSGSFLDGLSIRPSISFDDDINVNLSATADKGVTDSIDVFAGPVIGYDSTGDDSDINLGLAAGADWEITNNIVLNGTAILGSNDSTIRLGAAYGF